MANNNKNVYKNEVIDYAFIKHDSIATNTGWVLAEDPQYTIGSEVRPISFPKYYEGDTVDIQPYSNITSLRAQNGGYYSISGRILHGGSGGVVVDRQNKVVGIVRVGLDGTEESADDSPPGFIPINRVLSDLHEHFKPEKQ